MDQDSGSHLRPEFGPSSSSGSSSFMGRILSKRRQSSDATVPFNIKGPLGMNMLYSPSEPLMDYVFVHGLGGGSTKTWCLGDNPNNFWPRTWLPMEPSFRNVRIHSFGYDANWMDKKKSIMNVHDFGRSLLESMRTTPSLKASETSPIVCVGHSLGGLVIKQAYVLARQDPSCTNLASRLKAMVFLATPHKGSDLASALNNILRLSASHSPRAYISNLDRTSELLALLNDSFRHYIPDLILFSFYESQQTSLGIRSAIIVQKDSAILECPGERIALLNANHRGICKYNSPTDDNYITVRNVLQEINERCLERLQVHTEEQSRKEMLLIDQYLGGPGKPEDDLQDLEETRIEGSCLWFAEREAFQNWIDSETTPNSQLYWISAKPATGKSVLSAYIINALDSLNLDCSYYFFRYGDKERSTTSGFLRSLAFQMALLNASVRGRLLNMINRGIRFDKNDAKAIWRKVFLPTVFKAEWQRTQYWVVDALDECSDIGALFSMLASIEPNVKIRILITSRKTADIAAQFAKLQALAASGVTLEEIGFEDTKSDMKLYLDANRDRIHVGDAKQRQGIVERILEKSEGCFLWIRLVLEELAMAWSIQHAEHVLTEVPQDMDPLYTRAISIMASKPIHARELAQAILTWTVCAIRPLTVPELRAALDLDTGAEINDLEVAIASLCAQLVYIDKSERVLMVHLTARKFLLDAELESDFAIVPKSGHLKLAKSCLKSLCSGEMKPLKGRQARKYSGQIRGSLFTSYASVAFAEHIRQTTSKDNPLAGLLDGFLKSNVPSWIEHVAATKNLSILTQTANSLKNYIQRRLQHISPMDRAIQYAENWIVDLQRIPTKFGDTLIASPSAIHSLIPPFCPESSAIRSAFGHPPRGIRVQGLTDNGWDDRLACINRNDKQVVSVACGESIFAVGLQPGQIVLYHYNTCQEWKSLDHQSVLRYMHFDSTGNILATAGRKDIRVWNVESGLMLWNFVLGQEILSLAFFDSDKTLVAATKVHTVRAWYLQTGHEADERRWDKDVDFGDEGHFRRPPLTVAFSPDETLTAIVYRGRPICLWDLEDRSLHGFVGREKDPSSLALGTNTSPASLVFNTKESLTLLAAAYEDGDLCLFDYEELRLIQLVEANAQVVACRPDGVILASGNSAGMVQLMAFETLQLLYRVNASDYSIRCIAFSTDNLRFFDTRGTQCNVWEPAVLSGLVENNDTSTDGEQLKPKIVGMSDGELEIVTIVKEDSGDFVFVGKSDGTVCVYDLENGVQRKVLYRHTYQISVTSMCWGSTKNIIVTADAASRFIACKLDKDQKTGWTVAAKLMDRRVKTAIQDVLLDPSNDSLLVSEFHCDSLWTIGAQHESKSKEKKIRGRFQWTNHPRDPRLYVVINAEAIMLVRWESLETEKESAIVYPAAGQHPTQLVVENVILFRDDDRFVIELTEPHGQRLTAQLLVYHTSILDVKAAEPSLIEGLQLVSQNALRLIGGHDSRLVFLSRQLWVCSIDMRQRGGRTSYTRHFAIPSDWHSQRQILSADITCQGVLVFNRREEIAVIKNGLEAKEEISTG